MDSIISIVFFLLRSRENQHAAAAMGNDESLLPKWPRWTFDREVIGALEHPLVCGFTLLGRGTEQVILCRAG